MMLIFFLIAVFTLKNIAASGVPDASTSQVTSPTDGCRSPSDFYKGVSCESCCDQNMGDCEEHSGDVWYNSVRFLGAVECPAECPQCASCSLRNEETLQNLVPPPSCDPNECKNMKIGVDPCFGMGSCECFCETANRLLQRCPQVKPDWLSLLPVVVPFVVPEPVTPVVSHGPVTPVVSPEPATSVVIPEPVTVDIPDPATPVVNPEPVSPEPAVPSDTITPTIPAGVQVPEPADWPGCPAEKQCLAGDIMPSGPNDPMASALSCCLDTEDCIVNFQFPELGGTCQPMGVPETQAQLLTWTMHGPYDLKAIQGESESLRMIFAQTLQLDPMTTQVEINRIDGVVEIAFQMFTSVVTMDQLEDPMFRVQFEQNILQANPDLARSLFINEQQVTGFFVLEGFWEINAVDDFQEQLRNQFAFVLGTMPVDNIEEESTTRGKLVQVIFKAKGTPQQLMPLHDGAAFSRRFRENVMATDPGLASVFGWLLCPIDPPLGDMMCTGDMRCEYGRECCCGNCFPSLVVTCDLGKWVSMYTDACLGGGVGCSAPGAYGEMDVEVPDIEMPETDFENGIPGGIVHGLSRTRQNEEPSKTASKTNYVPLVVTMLVSISFGVLAGFLTKCVMGKMQELKNEENDVYYDISESQA